ncbi:MAG TPA: AraC family transcriptional regulator ligand-binding domain-containing protein [Kofleriaceae bacterium]
MYDLPGAYINELIELAGRWNVRPAEILKGLPVTHAQLADPTTRVPLRVCEAIVARAHQLTHEPALALHVGTQMRLSSHGFLGFAAMTARNVREALELAVRFAQTRTNAISLQLYVEGDTASLVIEENTPLDGLREFVVLALIAGIWQLGRALTGKVLAGIGECTFAEPEFVRRLPPLAGQLRFNRPNHRLVFAAHVLELPLVSADPVATQLAREQCERELAALVDAGLPGRVRTAINARSDAPSLTVIARELRMSPRTLKRKLAEHGTTFSAIRDDMRRQRALLLLDNRGLSIGEIATKLGYSELPNFTRAFRKWTGVTPIAYRERAR